MSSAPSSSLTSVVKPYTARTESLLVLAACLLVIVLMGLRFFWLQQHADKIQLQPYQTLDTILTLPQRTLYRNLYASVDDIIELRNQGGWWPETSLLKQEIIPPFATRLLPAALQNYIWAGYDGGSWIDYLGSHPDQDVTFILRLIDLHAGYHPHPHPGVDYDPNVLIAVQIWYFPAAARPYPGERLPEAGWYWLMQENDPLLRQQHSATQSVPPARK